MALSMGGIVRGRANSRSSNSLLLTMNAIFKLFFCFTFLTNFATHVNGVPNYKDALAKSLIFFQGQRSGRVPAAQQISWRATSGLSDGRAAGVRAYIHTHVIIDKFLDTISSSVPADTPLTFKNNYLHIMNQMLSAVLF